MSTTATHSIGKLSFHLKGVRQEKIFAMRQQVASYLQHNFERLVEEVFDDFALDDEVIFIQQLSIDLQLGNSFDLRNMEYSLREQIREQIIVQLQQQKSSRFILSSTDGRPENNSKSSDANILLQAWAFYLERGHLPAYMSFALWQERLSWWKKAFAQPSSQLKEFFILQLSGEQRLKRFLKHEPAKVQQWIFEQLHPELFSLIVKGRVKRNQTLSLSHFELKTYLQFLLSGKHVSVLINNDELPSVDWVMQHHETLHRPAKQLSPRPEEPTEKKAVPFPEDDHQPIIIQNAGIVLLQPFISTLFNELHILSDDRKTIIDKNKACALLSVLAGDEEQDEIHYPLYKLLCAVPIHEVIDSNVELTINEREECFHLLQQVIVHWPSLKQSSVPSLQQTFFQRTGKLTQKEDKWLLQVEQRTEDVLLQYLPWSYSIIRYPWMKLALFVEWT